TAGGQFYQLPCPMQSFLNQGWEAGTKSTPETIDGKSFTRIDLSKDGKRLSLRAGTNSDEPCPWRETTVWGAEIKLDTRNNENPADIDFVSGDGIAMGTHFQTVVDLYGKPVASDYSSKVSGTITRLYYSQATPEMKGTLIGPHHEAAGRSNMSFSFNEQTGLLEGVESWYAPE
ncbi:MAG: hypothetical protein IJ131_02800, partial [Eggerthellaceae bacterium]|nr:hypothetical protein [Eggerthellaceae bacterium]